MNGRSLLWRRLAAAVLLATLGGAAGLHHHEDLAGALSSPSGVAPDRVVSNHSPFSKASHWHAGVSVKDDPCLACKSHRTTGVPFGACLRIPLAIAHLSIAALSAAPASVPVRSNGSRAPPALL